MKPNITDRVLIAILNGKGGVGKTLISSIIADWLELQLLRFILYDCDDNQSLTRLLPQASQHSLKASDGIETLIGKILEGQITIADTPANISTELAGLFSSVDFGPSMEAINGRLVAIAPILSTDAAALDEVRRMVTAVKLTASYVIVKNEREGTDFSAFDTSVTGQFLKSAGAMEIHLPKLDSNLQNHLNVDRLTLSQFVGRFWAIQKTDAKAAFRQTVAAQLATRALGQVFSALNEIAPFVLPTEFASKVHPVTTADIRDYCCAAWAKKQAFIEKRQ